jgi:AraC-like DNA-binding protein
MPALHLLVNLGSAFQVQKEDRTASLATCTESWFGGLTSTYHLIDCPPYVRFFGVHFKPGGASPFLHLPLSDFHNQVVELSAIWGRDTAAEIRERLSASTTVQAGFSLLEHMLLEHLETVPYRLELVQEAIREISRQHGILSIRALSDRLGLSQNYLGSLFKRMVGMAPKEVARFYRLAHIFHFIHQTPSMNWTRIAHESGFYDQSHFTRELVALTGHSPTEYLHQTCPMHVETAEPSTSPALSAN